MAADAGAIDAYRTQEHCCQLEAVPCICILLQAHALLRKQQRAEGAAYARGFSAFSAGAGAGKSMEDTRGEPDPGSSRQSSAGSFAAGAAAGLGVRKKGLPLRLLACLEMMGGSRPVPGVLLAAGVTP